MVRTVAREIPAGTIGKGSSSIGSFPIQSNQTDMKLTGHHLIGGRLAVSSGNGFRAVNPTSGQAMEPEYHEATLEEVDRAVREAAGAFDVLRGQAPEARAVFLDALAEAVLEAGDGLLQRTHEETGLPLPRLTAERGRALNQAKMFAGMLREGSWVDARIDRPDPGREPMPKPDVRRMLRPVGPVVVFGASNFPLAISVIGSDTVSALAAGCPVVVKAHPAHPGTCEFLGNAVTRALAKCGLPPGAFSLLHGRGNEVGLALVNHPYTAAVSFTGSLTGGRALFDAATARPNPVPVYAEMGSVNPVFLLPGALKRNGPDIARAYLQSVTLGCGQFCTNPGIVFGTRGPEWNAFHDAVAAEAGNAPPATMLHAGIREGFEKGLERLESATGVRLVGRSNSEPAADQNQAACHIFATNAASLRQNPHLWQEIFGPTSLLVECESAEELEQMADVMEGQLTGTVHGTAEDFERAGRLLQILERKVGRLIRDGFPTGIEVCAAMQHGGPYPATTHSHFTSIGTASILRFVRPVCYQNFPETALPVELHNQNYRRIWRLIDGEWTKEDL